MSTEPQAKEYFIKKRGLYYRPDSCGYTDRPILAGLYTLADAISASHPNGFDGPRDGISYLHESECGDTDYVIFKAQRARITQLEEQLKMVLDRESATHARHDDKVSGLETQIEQLTPFAKMGNWAIEDLWLYVDLESSEIFDAAESFGLVEQVEGGFDPLVHTDNYGSAEPGDPWYSKAVLSISSELN